MTQTREKEGRYQASMEGSAGVQRTGIRPHQKFMEMPATGLAEATNTRLVSRRVDMKSTVVIPHRNAVSLSGRSITAPRHPGERQRAAPSQVKEGRGICTEQFDQGGDRQGLRA